MLNIFSKKTSKVQKVENYIHSTEDILIKAINDLMLGNKTYLDKNEIGLEKIAVVWNKMLDSLCNNRGKCLEHLGRINNSVETLTKMDFAKELIEDVRIQRASLESMAANSQEMAASVDEVA